MRNTWEFRERLMPRPSTGVMGHSWGGTHAVIFKTGAHGGYMSSSTPRCPSQSSCNLVRSLDADFATTFLTKYLPPEFAFIAPSFIPDSLIVRPDHDLLPPPADGYYAGSYLLRLSNSRQSSSGSLACSQEVRWETTSAAGTTFLVPGWPPRAWWPMPPGLTTPSVDLLTIKELGGWKTLSMVQRYAHLSPGHRHTAIERLAARKVEPDKASGAE
jgi:hypothetical protein